MHAGRNSVNEKHQYKWSELYLRTTTMTKARRKAVYITLSLERNANGLSTKFSFPVRSNSRHTVEHYILLLSNVRARSSWYQETEAVDCLWNSLLACSLDPPPRANESDPS
jgi:hypothetical protein